MQRFAILIEGQDTLSIARGLIVFTASDQVPAKRRALELGLSVERSYTGGCGQEIRWRLAAAETLDMLGDVITDGREVYFEQLPAGRAIPFDTMFDPGSSEPSQSGSDPDAAQTPESMWRRLRPSMGRVTPSAPPSTRPTTQRLW
jgi:hypothetical protein